MTVVDVDRPLAVSVREAARLLSIGKDAVYRQIRDGRLKKLPLAGSAVRVTVASIDRLIAEAEEAAS